MLAPAWAKVWRAAGLSADAEARLENLIALEKRLGDRMRTSMPISSAEVMAVSEEFRGKKLGEALAALQRSYWNEQWSSRDEGLKWLRNHTL
jgi:hypothetical protein